MTETRPTAAAWRDGLIANCLPDLLSLDGANILRYSCQFRWEDGEDVLVVGIDTLLGQGGYEQVKTFLASSRARWPTVLEKLDFEWWDRQPLVITEAHSTDLGNAQRLVATHGADLRYCHPWRRWLVWDGRRWRVDDTAEVIRRAKDTVRGIYSEAARAAEEKERKALAKHAMASEAHIRIRAMIALTESEPGIPVLPDALDADPWLLNCLNGTVDLETGELREHRPEDLITKLAPVHFDPNAKLELWDSFLRDTTGDDQELIDFLQCATGYTLTGDVTEEVLFFVHGPTETGKSTFIEAIKATLGDYAATADFETFLARAKLATGAPRPDIARLAGARFVASVEVAEGKRLAEGLIRLLTGGDRITVRFLYTREFEFDPTFKLWLAANDAPKIKDDDDATWRRILRVPFEHAVQEPDPKVKATLRDPKVAGSAILAWAVKGCLDWQRDRLKIPKQVTRATEDLRDEMDPLKEFFDDCCTFGPECWTSASQLWAAYEGWAAESGDRFLVRGKKWGDRLRAKNCEKKRRSVGGKREKGWLGIGLLDQVAPILPNGPDSEPLPKAFTYNSSRKGLNGNTGPTGATGAIGDTSDSYADDALVQAVEDLGGEVVKVETPDGAVEMPF